MERRRNKKFLYFYLNWPFLACDSVGPTGNKRFLTSFLGGSAGSCEPRRQEAVCLSDNHIQWTMLQIGVSASEQRMQVSMRVWLQTEHTHAHTHTLWDQQQNKTVR